MISIVPYNGWSRLARLTNGTVDLLVTLEVGPRIIRFGFVDGPNEFVEYPDQMGKVGDAAYRSYGGHRLWVAPETKGWTDHPDNGPVALLKEEEDSALFTPAVETGTGLQKRLRIAFLPSSGGVRVEHLITNAGGSAVQLAPWALSVMAAGGTAVIPHERHIPHPEKVLPARPLSLWHYTDMTDPRWTWGRRYVFLRQDPRTTDPQKFGALVTEGWAAYVNGDRIFLKRFPYDPAAEYPDFGVNAEFFTNGRMLEVESLGSLVTLKPGETTSHTEHWYLARSLEAPMDEEAWHRRLSELLQETTAPAPPDRRAWLHNA
ncbi:MAG: DUF4380 domain-containing protein [Bacteroidetes bacterium]|jgi:hypothetical protein|nr:DUF4380 domain-containing protein [Bacteroidota bacterium]